MQKITLNLDVKLTAKELQDKAQEMATAVLQYDEYEAEKKEIAKDLGDKMKDLHGKLSELAKVTRKRSQVRPVECTVELNTPEVGTKRITRVDTKAIIKEMAMTMEERQSNLFEDSIDELNKMFDLESNEPPPAEPEQPSA